MIAIDKLDDLFEDKIELRGVQIPTDKSIYEPVLDELSSLGISFDEKTLAL